MPMSDETAWNDHDEHPSGGPETEEIDITCTWRSSHRVEVPIGWRPAGKTLSEFPTDVLDEIDSHTAELVDWE